MEFYFGSKRNWQPGVEPGLWSRSIPLLRQQRCTGATCGHAVGGWLCRNHFQQLLVCCVFFFANFPCTNVDVLGTKQNYDMNTHFHAAHKWLSCIMIVFLKLHPLPAHIRILLADHLAHNNPLFLSLPPMYLHKKTHSLI